MKTHNNPKSRQPMCQFNRISLTIPELKSLNFIKGIGQLSEENRRIRNEVILKQKKGSNIYNEIQK